MSDPQVTNDSSTVDWPREFLNELNRFRKGPLQYVKEMEQLLEFHEILPEEDSEAVGMKKIIVFPSGVASEAVEGKESLLSLIEDVEGLYNSDPYCRNGIDMFGRPDEELDLILPIFHESPELSKACRDHVVDLCSNNRYSHIGSDGSTPEDRILRYGKFSYARQPYINHPIDKKHPKSTHPKMNNTTNHKFRSNEQSRVIDQSVIQKEIKTRQPIDKNEKKRKIRVMNNMPRGGPGSEVEKSTNSVFRRPVGYQVAENVHFGLNTARDILYQFLLDDRNDRSKEHRQNILNRDFRHIGFHFSYTHPTTDTCACLILTDSAFFPTQETQVRLQLAQEYISNPISGYQQDDYYDIAPKLKSPRKAAYVQALKDEAQQKKRKEREALQASKDKSPAQSQTDAKTQQNTNSNIVDDKSTTIKEGINEPGSDETVANVKEDAEGQADAQQTKEDTPPETAEKAENQEEEEEEEDPEVKAKREQEEREEAERKRKEEEELERKRKEEEEQEKQRLQKEEEERIALELKEKQRNCYPLSIDEKVDTVTWQDLVELVKPDQYKLSKQQEQRIPHLVKPLKRLWRYIPPKIQHEKYYKGELDLHHRKRYISKKVTKAFCQQLSSDGDNTISYDDLRYKLLEVKNIQLNDTELYQMFEDILAKRPSKLCGELRFSKRIWEDELLRAIQDVRTWVFCISVMVYPKVNLPPGQKPASGGAQGEYELVCQQDEIDNWLVQMCEKYGSYGFYEGKTPPNPSARKPVTQEMYMPTHFPTLGQDIMQFLDLQKNPQLAMGCVAASTREHTVTVSEIKEKFQKDLLSFFGKPIPQQQHMDIYGNLITNYDLVDLKFINPRKLWIEKRPKDSEKWLGILDCLHVHPTNKHTRDPHFFNRHLLDVDNTQVPRQNEARHKDECTRSKIYDKTRSDAWDQNQGYQRLNGGAKVNNLNPESKITPLSDNVERGFFQTRKPIEKPLATCHSLRMNSLYPGDSAVKVKKSIVLSENGEESTKQGREIEVEINASCIGPGDSSSIQGQKQLESQGIVTIPGMGQYQVSQTLDGKVNIVGGGTEGGSSSSSSSSSSTNPRVTFSESKNTFIQHLGKQQRLSDKMAAVHSLKVSNTNNRTCSTSALGNAGASIINGGNTGQQTTNLSQSGLVNLNPNTILGGGKSNSNNNAHFEQKDRYGLHHSTNYPDNVPAQTRLAISGPILNTKDAVCSALDKIPYLTTGDSIPQIGQQGMKLLNPPKFSLSSNFQDSYNSTLLCHKTQAITFGNCTIELEEELDQHMRNLERMEGIRKKQLENRQRDIEVMGAAAGSSDLINPLEVYMNQVMRQESINNNTVTNGPGEEGMNNGTGNNNNTNVNTRNPNLNKGSNANSLSNLLNSGPGNNRGELDGNLSSASPSPRLRHILPGSSNSNSPNKQGPGTANSSKNINGQYSPYYKTSTNPNTISTSSKQMSMKHWYSNHIGVTNNMSQQQVGSVKLHSGLDIKTKIMPLLYKNEDANGIDNHVLSGYYNNHGLFYHNTNNQTSNTISGAVLENNAKLLSKKQTKSTLSLDKEELYRYIATDQNPITSAVNHHDLGTHLDHAKLQPRDTRGGHTIGNHLNEFQSRNKELCDSPRTSRIKATDGTKYVVGKFTNWKKFEFRKDEPIRIGNHGKRHFNAENLGERELPINSNISHIEQNPNPKKITNFLNLTPVESKDANYDISVVRNDSLRNRTFMDLAYDREKWKAADLSKCAVLNVQWTDK